jgi:hypothetical protein
MATDEDNEKGLFTIKHVLTVLKLEVAPPSRNIF